MTQPRAADAASPDASMIRSEERLELTVQRVPVGKAVLRKVIVVEQRTVTIEVAHEEVRLEYVPFEDGRPDADERRGTHLTLPELVLYEEQVVISKRTVATERVRAQIVTVTDDRQITADLRQERVEIVSPLQA